MDKTDPTHDGPPEAGTPMRSADVLLWGALPNLQLNIAQTADLCGISVRQLGYWTKQGYVAASGRGARRMYGLDALRHVLAIKNAMAAGASLRQALRALPGVGAAVTPPALTGGAALSAQPAAAGPSHPPLSAQERDSLTADIMALFAANRHTRDDAAGLAVKIGRATTDIRDIAESLCTRGALLRTVSQGSVVFESPRKGSA